MIRHFCDKCKEEILSPIYCTWEHLDFCTKCAKNYDAHIKRAGISSYLTPLEFCGVNNDKMA